MFFVLSKVLGFFSQPSNVILVAALFGVALMATRHGRAGRRIAATGIVLLALLGMSPLGRELMLVLENRFPKWDASRGAPDGIIVLGGPLNPVISQARGDIALSGSVERLTAGAELARRYPSAKLVFSGGSSRLFDGPREADFVEIFWKQLGLSGDRFILESDARTTYENGLLTKALVRPQAGERWLLVTSSWHMPRAVGVFRKLGFTVEPYPVDWVSTGRGDWEFPVSLGNGLARLDEASREWVGLAAYWLTGRSSEFFPGPRMNGECDEAEPAPDCRR